MRMLKCACIVGAVAVLFPMAQRTPARAQEASRPQETLRARAETMAVASLKELHANLEAAFAALARAGADLTPVASLGGPKIKSLLVKPAVALEQKVLAFAEPAPSNTYFDPTPIGPAKPIVAESLGLVPVPALADLSPASSDKHDFAYLAYWVYSETPPPEKPAITVLNALRDTPQGTPVEEIKRVSDAFGLDFNYMKAVAKIESGLDPKQRTGSYIGLYQLSKFEFKHYGDGDILNARDNAVAAAYKIMAEAIIFELRTHKKPTLSDLYLIHQQGIQGAEEHVSHPERLAWESMCATDEGQQKGEKWCKRAIWGNTLPEVKKVWKSVENMTSGAFVAMWQQRVAEFYGRYSRTAEADAAK
jgi:soluble lytic murein transglycosylase-like protein